MEPISSKTLQLVHLRFTSLVQGWVIDLFCRSFGFGHESACSNIIYVSHMWEKGHLEILDLLVRHGGDPVAKSLPADAQRTPLIEGSSHGSPSIVRYVCCSEMCDSECLIPIKEAAFMRLNFHWYLFYHQVSFKLQICEGGHWPSGKSEAVVTAVLPVVLIDLCNHGRQSSFQDDFGRTAFYHACRYGRAEVARLLLAAGADPTIADIYNEFPLEAVIYNEHPECQKVLEVSQWLIRSWLIG